MGNSSHHDCYQPGCTNQVAWSTNSCYCPTHRAAEDSTVWDGRDVTKDNMTYHPEQCGIVGCINRAHFHLCRDHLVSNTRARIVQLAVDWMKADPSFLDEVISKRRELDTKAK